MVEAAKNDPRDRFRAWNCEPYGTPSASSEVSKVPNFYRVECLTVFGTARCGSASVEAAPFEFQAAA